MQGHSNKVYSVSFNHDGSILASGSFDQSIKLWSMPSGEPIKTLTVSEGEYLYDQRAAYTHTQTRVYVWVGACVFC